MQNELILLLHLYFILRRRLQRKMKEKNQNEIIYYIISKCAVTEHKGLNIPVCKYPKVTNLTNT